MFTTILILSCLTSNELREDWRLGGAVGVQQSDFDEPLARNLWASFGVWRLVGNGVVTHVGRCGRFAGFYGCGHPIHDHLRMLDGSSFAGKLDVQMKHKVCYNFRCPVCYLSWAVREAQRAGARVEAFGKQYGLVEHIVLSVPVADYGLEFDVLIKKALRVAKLRLVFGGAIVFHPFRYADYEESRRKGVPFGWRFEPHFHVLGFIYGGRGNKAFFKAVSDGFKVDGWVVKLESKRKTLVGTLWYELNHAGYDSSRKKFNVLRWFGVCCRKPKAEIVKDMNVCRICGHELGKLTYCGHGSLKKDLDQCGRGDRRFFADRFDVDGSQVWLECDGG